jgi:hypothetical protein
MTPGWERPVHADAIMRAQAIVLEEAPLAMLGRKPQEAVPAIRERITPLLPASGHRRPAARS